MAFLGAEDDPELATPEAPDAAWEEGVIDEEDLLDDFLCLTN